MFQVVGVSFKNKGKEYYFNVGTLDLKRNDEVIVETERGLQFGVVKTGIISIEESKLKSPLKNVVRIATKADKKSNQKNIEAAKSALKRCRSLVEKYKLNMYIIDANYTFEREQLLFHFLSEGRIDFRTLARDLASIYHTRIELRQIGVRDKAKEIGGIGFCGHELCCAKFLSDFDSVSINMAKNQNIALNPSKINGVCGRLLCCLKYEDDDYTEARKTCPKIGSTMKTDKGEGTVSNVDILKETCKVDIPKVGMIEVKIKNEKA